MRLSVGMDELYLFTPANSEGIAEPVDIVASIGIAYSPVCALSGILMLKDTGSIPSD